MKNREYMFTNKHYTKGGFIATILGFIACVLCVAGIFMSYKQRGQGTSIVGLMGAGALLVSIAGAIIGIKSFKEEDKFYTFSWLGSFICCVVAIFMIIITGIGVTM